MYTTERFSRAARIALGLLAVGFSSLATESRAQSSFEFQAPNVAFTLQPGVFDFSLGFSIEQVAGPSAGTLGFGMGVAHDPSLLSILSVDEGPALDVLPFPTAFFTTVIDADGWAASAVYTVLGSALISFPVPTEAVTVTYRAGESGSVDPTDSSPLTWTNDIGLPPIMNLVVVGGFMIFPDFVDGLVAFAEFTYVRGDMNNDGNIDLSDVFTAEDYLFLGGPTPDCLVALDANADTSIDIADLIYLLSYMFIGGDDPPSPFPRCGAALPSDTFECEEHLCP